MSTLTEGFLRNLRPEILLTFPGFWGILSVALPCHGRRYSPIRG